MIYASTDPAERNRQTVTTWIAISIVILGFCGFAVAVWLTR